MPNRYGLARPDAPRTLHVECRTADNKEAFLCGRPFSEKKVYIENEHPTFRCCLECTQIELHRDLMNMVREAGVADEKVRELEAETIDLENDIVSIQKRLRDLGEEPS